MLNPNANWSTGGVTQPWQDIFDLLGYKVTLRKKVGGGQLDEDSVEARLIREFLADLEHQCVPDMAEAGEGNLSPAVPGTQLKLNPQVFAGFRPSYRCLAWYLAQKGYAARPDLLGEDQPEAVARQHEAEAAWLTEASGSVTLPH